jgi:DNA-directed RNA polymerase specialized sigma24 family protein
MVFGLIGSWLAIIERRLTLGLSLFAIATSCILVHMALQHRDRRREDALQKEWTEKIRAIADDLTLEGYGIVSLSDLAKYHDAAGRAAVLAALEALPPGQRSLLTAARAVEPDAQWD